jgi:hypothetical protein
LSATPPLTKGLLARIDAYERLVRLDKPIGTLLLLWPTMIALWLAIWGKPPLHLVLIFAMGTLLMRSAGCAFNDWADRRFDAHVVLGCTVGNVVGRQVRDPQANLVARRLGVGELTLHSLQLLLDPAQLLELLRRRLAFHLGTGAEVVGARHEFAPLFVGGEPGVEHLAGASASQPATKLVRLVAGGSGVDHAMESR